MPAGVNGMSIRFPQPDARILARREAIIEGLRPLVAAEALIVSEDERRAFETDALTAYRKMPLAVVLPSTTEEVSAVLKFCHGNGVKVVARGAGTSLAGGAIPQEDAIILGVAKMNRVLEVDFANRTARVQSGITNLAISQAVAHEGFFYAPDPSSQLACTIAGNIAMNSGGAHCLKYGVTTNNLLGVTLVLVDVTEAVVRVLRAAEGARPALMGFETAEDAGACVAAIIGAGIIPVAMEYMDRPAIQICEAFAHAGYPLDVEAMLIVEVEGSDAECDDMLKRIVAIAEPFRPKTIKVSQSEAESAGEDILRLCVEVGGCLTGEHGVGIEKRDLMTYQFNAADLAQQMRVRGVFDPLWLLNPAKVFPLEGRLAA